MTPNLSLASTVVVMHGCIWDKEGNFKQARRFLDKTCSLVGAEQNQVKQLHDAKKVTTQ
jgi:hypothetical protein